MALPEQCQKCQQPDSAYCQNNCPDRPEYVQARYNIPTPEQHRKTCSKTIADNAPDLSLFDLTQSNH